MKKIIFLDVDGVLNNADYLAAHSDFIDDMNGIHALDPQAVRLLEAIHREHDPDWVLSSVWRYVVTPARMTAMLRELGWTGTVVDSTPILSEGGRGREINKWLEDTDSLDRPFVILDDDKDMDPWLHHLVQTTFARGLQPIHIEGVRRKFLRLAGRGSRP